MPGPVSDSYDPEFGTGENARAVRDAIGELISRAVRLLGKKKLNIIELAYDPAMCQKVIDCKLTEREWRIIRFGLQYARDAI